MGNVFYCLYCNEGNFGDPLIKNGKCTSCGRKLVFDGYRAVIRYEGSLTGSTVQNLVERSFETYQVLENEIIEAVEDAENGISESVENEIKTHLYLPFIDNPGLSTNIDYNSRDEMIGKLFFATALSYFDAEYNLEFVQPVSNPSTELGRTWARDSPTFRAGLQYIAMEASDPVFSDFNKGVGGTYNSGSDRIEMKKFPSDAIEAVKSKVDVPELMKPFLDFLKAGNEKYLEATLNHEMTHAYVRHRSNYNREKTYARAMEEAACWAVNYVREGRDRIRPDSTHYRNKGFPKALFKTSIKLFIDYADSVNGSEEQKISGIRKHTINAVEKAEKGTHPLKAIAGELDPQLQKIYSALKSLEAAEYYCFHALSLTGVVKPTRDLREWTHDMQRGSSPYQVGGNRKPLPEPKNHQPLMEKHVQTMKKAVKELGQKEKYSEAEELREDLKTFLKVFEAEKNYFNKTDDRSYNDFENTVIDMLNKNRSVQHVINKNDSETIRDIEELAEKTRKIVQEALKYNSSILNVLQKLHSDEESLKADSQALDRLKQETSEEYQVFQRTQKGLEKSLEYLEEVSTEL